MPSEPSTWHGSRPSGWPTWPLPIAKAWKRDGINSRIAASTYYRGLASIMWPGEVTDKELLEFATTRGGG